ncbi:uncharacterized protein [Nicotiana sylvestris]|uniref:uncharacterized protein n=1 Tax=Nicotiana sylvestris TaxID=4096 RepID=UPI00388C4946
MYVSILGEQVIKIHEKLDKLIAEVQKIQQKDTKGKEKIATASIQPPPELKEFKLKSLDDVSLQNIEELLVKKLGEFRASPLSLEHASTSNLKVDDEINKISEKVMELPESNSTHWKSKFIDGLPPLFAERIRKFTIDIPSKKKKSHKKDFKRKKGPPEKRQEKSQRRKVFHKARKGFIKSKNPHAYYKCGRVGHYAKDCKIKDKIKELDLDDQIKDSLCKILLNSSPEISDTDEGSSSTSEDLRVLHEESYTSSYEEEQEFCNKGQCSNHCCNTDDELFNIYSQFRDLKINVLSNENLIDLLRVIKDPALRSQLIDKIPTSSEVGSEVEDIPSQKRPYTMSEIRKMVKNKSQPERLATVQDLSIEINYLKKEISELMASNVALDERIFRLEKSVVINTDPIVKITKIDNIASSSKEKTANTLLAVMDFPEDDFLGKQQYFITQIFLIKITN